MTIMQQLRRSFTSFRTLLASPDASGSRGVFASLFILWLLGQAFGQLAESCFAIVPGFMLSSYYLWTFMTAGAFDNSFSMGLINMIVFIAAAPALERIWGRYTFIKFLCVTNLCINVSIFFSMVACYAATAYEPCLFRAVCGFSGVNAALAVALKQKFGERPCIPGVHGLSIIKFKHLPMFLGWLSIFLWIFDRLSGKEAPLIFFGTFYSWMYLRFFLLDPNTGVTGDLRPEFAAISFVPPVPGFRPLVAFIATVMFQIVYRLGIIEDAVKSNTSLPTTQKNEGETLLRSSGVGTDGTRQGADDPYRTVDPTAERRRLLAIKAIDEKLAQLSREGSGGTSETLVKMTRSASPRIDTATATASLPTISTPPLASSPQLSSKQQTAATVTATPSPTNQLSDDSETAGSRDDSAPHARPLEKHA